MGSRFRHLCARWAHRWLPRWVAFLSGGLALAGLLTVAILQATDFKPLLFDPVTGRVSEQGLVYSMLFVVAGMLLAAIPNFLHEWVSGYAKSRLRSGKTFFANHDLSEAVGQCLRLILLDAARPQPNDAFALVNSTTAKDWLAVHANDAPKRWSLLVTVEGCKPDSPYKALFEGNLWQYVERRDAPTIHEKEWIKLLVWINDGHSLPFHNDSAAIHAIVQRLSARFGEALWEYTKNDFANGGCQEAEAMHLLIASQLLDRTAKMANGIETMKAGLSDLTSEWKRNQAAVTLKLNTLAHNQAWLTALLINNTHQLNALAAQVGELTLEVRRERESRAAARLDNPMAYRSWRQLANLGYSCDSEFNRIFKMIDTRLVNNRIESDQERVRIIRPTLEAFGMAKMRSCVSTSLTDNTLAALFGFAHAVIAPKGNAILREDQTGVEMHEALCLLAAVAAHCPRVSWRSESSIVDEWLGSSSYIPPLGGHWVLAIAAMSGEDSLRQEIKQKLFGSTATSSSTPRTVEHAMLNMLEGINAFLYAIATSREARPTGLSVGSATMDCLSTISYNYYDQAVLVEPEHELRICFNMVGLTRCMVLCNAIGIPDSAEQCRVLRDAAQSRLGNERLRESVLPVCAAILDGVITAEFLPMMLRPEGLFDDLQEPIQEALLRFYEVAVVHRKDYNGAGWRSWKSYFGTYGMLAKNSKVQILAHRAMNMSSSSHS